MRSQEKLLAPILEQLVLYNNILNTCEIATVLNKHQATIQRYILNGKLRVLRNGKNYITTKKWLIEFLQVYGESVLSTGYNSGTYRQQRLESVLEYCREPRTYRELMEFTKLKTKSHLQKTVTRPLMKAGRLKLLYPETPHTNNQKYITVIRP